MKISQKQALLLAKEVVNQLKAMKVQKVPDTFRQKLKQWMDKRNQLMTAEKEAEEARRKYETTLKNLTGRNVYCEAYWSIDKIIEKIEEKNIPSVSEIEDEIILKSIFNDKNDMQSFISQIVKKYEKKVQNKIIAN